MLRLAGLAIGGTLVALLVAWGAASLRYSGLGPRLGTAAAVAWAVATLAALVLLRPLALGAAVAGGLFAAVVAAFVLVPPRNDRDWQPDVAVAPSATFDGDRVTIHGVRNFDYRSESDYDARWEERTYDLAKLASLDVSFTEWGAPGIAHTMMHFGFEDDGVLAISIETRKERGETYSAIAGFFRQYELVYVLADERDVVRLRTNHRRGERVRLYRVQVGRERIRALFLDYLETANALAAKPRWYNAATGNCTTGIRVHVKATGGEAPWDWRIIANARLDELLHERGLIDQRLPLADLRARSEVNAAAQAADQDPRFSERIRAGLPGMG